MSARRLPLLAVVVLVVTGCNPVAAPLATGADVATPAPVVKRAATPTTATALYARAEHLLDCANFADAALSETTAPPSAGTPALAPADTEPSALSQRRRACAGLGPGARAQAQRLLAVAAAHGDANAKVALLDQDANRLLAAVAARANSNEPAQMTAAERSQTEALIGALEQQAMQGNRRAIESLQQVLDSSVSALIEPRYAAAWRLVAQQPPGKPLPPDRLRGEEMLDDLDADTQQRITALARDLHAACCAH